MGFCCLVLGWGSLSLLFKKFSYKVGTTSMFFTYIGEVVQGMYTIKVVLILPSLVPIGDGLFLV